MEWLTNEVLSLIVSGTLLIVGIISIIIGRIVGKKDDTKAMEVMDTLILLAETTGMIGEDKKNYVKNSLNGLLRKRAIKDINVDNYIDNKIKLSNGLNTIKNENIETDDVSTLYPQSMQTNEVIGPRGLKGDKGDVGDKGEKGDKGDDAVIDYSVIDSMLTNVVYNYITEILKEHNIKVKKLEDIIDFKDRVISNRDDLLTDTSNKLSKSKDDNNELIVKNEELKDKNEELKTALSKSRLTAMDYKDQLEKDNNKYLEEIKRLQKLNE